MRGGVSKLVDVDKSISDIERVLEEGGKGEALGVVRAMLETLARRNAELELDLMRLLKKHVGKTSERVSAEQLDCTAAEPRDGVARVDGSERAEEEAQQARP